MKSVTAGLRIISTYLSALTTLLLIMLPTLRWLPTVAAENDSAWVNNSALKVTPSDNINVNFCATRRSAKTKKYSLQADHWTRANDNTFEGCATKTPLGIVFSSGYVQFAGSNYAQVLLDSDFRPLGDIYAVPGSKTLVVGGGLYGPNYEPHKTYLFDNIAAAGESVVHNGEQVFKVRAFPPPLNDDRGDFLIMSSIAISDSGQWMVAMVDDALVRIHIPTKKMQTFASGHSHRSAMSLAISNDGRYVVDTYDYNIYDLGSCQPNRTFWGVDSLIPGCQRREFLSSLRAAFGYVNFLGYPRFSPDGQQITALAGLWGKNVTATITRADYVKPKLTYLGMGDSFASGEGDSLGSKYYEPGTDEKENLCHLSRRSYPYLIAEQFGLNRTNQTPANDAQFHNVACSGATLENILNVPQPEDTLPSGKNLGKWHPGFQRQIDYINNYSVPSVITLSVGGNDVGFGEKLAECVATRYKIPAPTTCKYAGDATERANLAKEIAAQFQPLKRAYEQMANETQHKTRIYVIGYPQFVNPNGNRCNLNVRLNSKELQMVYEATKYLNQVSKAAAQAAGVYYVDVEHALDNYNLCSGAANKDMAFNGLTEGNDKHIPWYVGLGLGGPSGVVAAQRIGIGNESYHPNANGHARMKNTILAKLGNIPTTFEVCTGQPGVLVCPDADVQVPVPDGYFGNTAINYVNGLNSPNTSSIALAPPPQYTPLVVEDPPSYRHVHIRVETLKPNSRVEVLNKSTPTSLGAFTTDSEGVLDVTLTIPEGVEPGFHTLHVMGTDMADESVDYYDSIFISGPAGDLNGNNVPDTQESCGFAPGSHQDTDKDGIDDACDGYLGDKPAAQTTPTASTSATSKAVSNRFISTAVAVAAPDMPLLNFGAQLLFFARNKLAINAQPHASINKDDRSISSPTQNSTSISNKSNDNAKPNNNPITSLSHDKILIFTLSSVGLAAIVIFVVRRLLK